MKSRLLLLPLVASLGACSGGHDEGPVTPPVPEAVPGLISGELTALNKQTGAATIGNHQLDFKGAALGRSANLLDQLHVGMLLTVQTAADGKVDTVKFDDLLTAPVSFNDGKTLKVAGFELLGVSNINQFKLGQMIEVSGYALDSSRIQATYIAADDDTESSLEGAVTKLNDAKTSFMLGQVSISLDQANNALKNGTWVEVEGLMTSKEVAGELTELTINNAMVDIDTPDFAEVDGDVEVAGRISWVAQDLSHMVVNQNLAVGILNNTQFEDGSKAMLKPGVMVEVEGSWDLNAMRLNAAEVEFDGDDDVSVELPEFEAQGYADYNADTGVIAMNGIQFYVSPRTQFEDGLVKDQSFAQKWIEFSGYQQGQDYLVQEVESEEQNTFRVELEGMVEAGDKSGATLLGYQTSKDEFKAFVGKQVEAECDRTPDNLLERCNIEQDND